MTISPRFQQAGLHDVGTTVYLLFKCKLQDSDLSMGSSCSLLPQAAARQIRYDNLRSQIQAQYSLMMPDSQLTNLNSRKCISGLWHSRYQIETFVMEEGYFGASHSSARFVDSPTQESRCSVAVKPSSLSKCPDLVYFKERAS